ncbi:AAA family ATPase [Kitasatospora aureofaciens]|uniref:helix-turn-helix transcriptional regulator n=1 Tax=Kitasatospora aureofaciens TaxID=1894 RepID=UPI001C4512B8|nr:LuxR family transcriptional regulator [Kitasatospora aureofaciens]MBV6701812.1 AAA family ATPase [Kitasatospora aureofaciens]
MSAGEDRSEDKPQDRSHEEPERRSGRTSFVSRSAEVGQLDAVLDRLGRGAPAVVDISGGPGIGKSRLLDEFCLRARSRGVTVLRGRATEYEQHAPFQPFTDAFSDLDPQALQSAPELANTAAPILRGVAGVAGVQPPPPTPGGPLDRFGLYRAAADLLTHLGRAGLVVVLDDLHWADPASLELLDHLVRHPVSAPVVLVVARRDRQAPPSLTAALTRGVDSGAVLRIELGPLGRRECIEQLAPEVPPGRAAELYAASEGNPLYFLTLLQAHRAARPPRSPAASQLADRMELYCDAPTGLGALLLDELTPLSTAELRTVEAVAVLGDHATPGTLRLTTGHGEAELGQETRRLIRRDLIRPRSGGRWALRHPVLRRVIYENTDVGRRTALHHRAAAALAEAGVPAVERAHHVERSLAGWDPAAVGVLIEAAEQSVATAPASAAHWLRTVLRVLPDTPPYATQRRDLKLLRARALGVSGALRESRDLLHELIGELGPQDAAVRSTAVTLCCLTERHLGSYREAAALVRRELARLPVPSPEEAVALEVELSACALFAASYSDARAEVARTIEHTRTAGDETGQAYSLAVAAIGEAYEGEMGAARSFAVAASALVDALTDGDLAALCEPLGGLAWAEVFLESYADAERHAGRGAAIARRSGQSYVLPLLLLCQAYIHLQTCRLPSALELTEESETIARSIGSSELLAFSLASKARVLLHARPPGDPSALAVAEEAVAAAGVSTSWYALTAWGVLGHAALRAGDPQRARQALLHAGGEGELRELQPSVRPHFLELLTAEALAAGDLDAATGWASRALEEAERLGLPAQRAAALCGLAQVAAGRGETAAAADMFAEAAQQSAQSGAVLREAYALLLGAPVVKAAGDGFRAAAMWQRGHRLASDGGAGLLVGLAEAGRPAVLARVGGLARSGELPDRLAALTTRELEIVHLVAEGLTSRAAAARLCLSPRTVEAHLARIYQKVGVSSRAGLATLAAHSGVGGRV